MRLIPAPNEKTLRGMFGVASWFHVAADRITGMAAADQQHGALVIPGAMNSAFAFELYLKCLIGLEGNPFPAIHKLDVLFTHLTPVSQDVIRGFSTRGVEGIQHMLSTLYAKTHRETVPVVTFDYILTTNANAFEGWRYVFEGRDLADTDGLLIWTANSLRDATRSRIKMLRPDWNENDWCIWQESYPP
jgi:hypothetical protein